MAVFVLDRRKKPPMPCSKKRARLLLERGRARVHRLDISKAHALDAACVGEVHVVANWRVPTLVIKATGRGSYQRTRLNAFEFSRGYLARSKSAFKFQTGDLVRAVVAKGKKAGTYIGRVAIRASGSFNIQAATGLMKDIRHRFCALLQRADGYEYSRTKDSNQRKDAGTGRLIAAALSLHGLNAGVSRALR
jgi:hypothetical protein